MTESGASLKSFWIPPGDYLTGICSGSGLLDLLKQAKHSARRTLEEALERLGKATTLNGVATITGTFGHLDCLRRLGSKALDINVFPGNP